jgi:hypothetical protein
MSPKSLLAEIALRTAGGRARRLGASQVDRAPAGGTAVILRAKVCIPRPERLALIARRWRTRWTDVDQARAETRTTQSIDRRTGAGQTGECVAGAPTGACRGHHRHPKKWQPCWVSRWRHPTATTHHDRCRRRAGGDARSHRQCVRGTEPVARQRLSSSLAFGEATGHASPPD